MLNRHSLASQTLAFHNKTTDNFIFYYVKPIKQLNYGQTQNRFFPHE